MKPKLTSTAKPFRSWMRMQFERALRRIAHEIIEAKPEPRFT